MRAAARRAQGGALAGIVLALALLWAQVVAAQETPPQARGRGGELSEPLQAAADHRPAPPAQRGLGPAGADNPRAKGPGTLIETDDGLLVQVFSDRLDAAVVGGLTDAGARVITADSATDIATVSAAADELEDVAAVEGVRYVREVLEPLTSHADGPMGAAVVQPPCGAAHSEGDAQLDVPGLRSDWDVEGLGVEVGVLSDTWNRATGDRTDLNQDIASGDIPGATNPCPGPGRLTPVPVLSEYVGSEPIDEGRAMAQIVHDLAPAAEISYATAFNGDTSFANNIRALRNAGADVIVDDVFYFNEPAFQNGPIGVAVEEVVAGGAAYFSAIGNETETISGRNVSSYEAPAFRPTACPAGITGTCHDFDPGDGTDSTFGVTVASDGLLRMSLKWNEPWYGVTTDLDLFYVVDGVVVGQSVEANPTASKQPFEHISRTSTGGAVNVDVVVRKKAGASDPRFKLEHVRSAITASERSLSTGGDVMGPNSNGHAAAPNGVGVGAVRYNTGAVEGYSNNGPATWYWEPVVGSTPAAALPEPLVLAKPDLVATDGGRTTFFYDPTMSTTQPRFFGTSAAAPHAAAVAALLLDCNPSLTPAQITATLKATANPVSGGVPSNVGAGLVDGRAAGAAVCLPPPPGPAFSVSDASVVEGNGGFLVTAKTLSFTVQLSQPLPTAASVTYATADGTAINNSDYTGKYPTTVTFKAGETTKSFTVSVKGDTGFELDETMLVQLSNPVGAPLSDAQGVGTIVNDDAMPTLSVADVVVAEGNPSLLASTTKLTFTVRLSGAAPAGSSFSIATADGTAFEPGDYTRRPLTTVAVPAGATSVAVTVTVVRDRVKEGDEFLFLLVGHPVGLAIADGAAAGTIRNDD